MKPALFSLVLLASVGCRRTPASPPPAKGVAYWVWGHGGQPASPLATPLDVVYAQIETGFYPSLPTSLPPARAYYAVRRYEQRTVPAAQDAIALVKAVAKLPIAGVQIDFDCPTRLLPDYATFFLRELRQRLPKDKQLSITALPDWFRPRTAIAQVIDEVDEFVPQFYDNAVSSGAVAEPFDAARWGPVFNRFGKRYRIGVSTFSRVVLKQGSAAKDFSLWRPPHPYEFRLKPGWIYSASSTPAGELRLRFEAQRAMEIGYRNVAAGAAVEFTIASADSVRAAVEATRHMGDYCAGPVFFRWPQADESLTMPPTDVLAIASGAGKLPPAEPTRLETEDGRCVAVGCTDLFIVRHEHLQIRDVRYGIQASQPVEYFLPSETLPAGMTPQGRVEALIPAYTGRARLYLGRVVTTRPSEFKMQELP